MGSIWMLGPELDDELELLDIDEPELDDLDEEDSEDED